MERVQPIDATNEAARPRVLASVLAPLIILAAGVAAYANSFAGVFMFDDRLHILGDRRLAALWPPWEALSRRRAVVDYSLALNFAFGGERPWGYHAANLSIHLLAGLALFGLVRRTLTLPRWRGRFDTSATGLALVSATLWVVHPLQTQAVTYVIQRAESLMGLFYLVTLYAALRAFGSNRHLDDWLAANRRLHAALRALGLTSRTIWYAVAIGACALGMGSKAVMVTAPVMVLLFDRAFLFDTFRAALRRRTALYAGLAATWGVLWATGTTAGVLSPTRVNANVGFGFKGISPLDYLLTQSGVLVRYLELSLWPAPLCLDYSWSVARAPTDILLPGLFIGLLVVGTVWMYLKRPHWGFVGVWFFLVLAPTSSFVPIKDPMFEHRMYLSLAALAVAATIAGRSTVRLLSASIFGLEKSSAKLCAGLALIVGTALCYGTVRRNVVYHSEAGMWYDVRTKRPKSVRAAENYGTALLAENRIDEAYVALQEAVRSVPNSPEVRNGMGFCLVAMGRTEEAIDWFRTALKLKPHHRRARRNLASALLETNQIDDLVAFARSALSIDPRDTDVRLTLGNGLLQIGRSAEAAEQYSIIVGIDPGNASGWRNYCVALLAKGDAARAVEVGRKAVMLDPDSADGYNNLGIALASNQQFSEAAISFRSSIERQPSALAYYNLGKCLLTAGDAGAAVVAYEGALAIDGRHNDARYELGVALATQGKLDAAIAVYEHVLLLDPSHQRTRTALGLARTKKASSPSP